MKTTTSLINKIFSFQRCMKEKMSLQSDVSNLSVIQLHTLIFIKHHSSTPMKAVAEYLRVELPSATAIVDKLVKLLYVKRQTDKGDRRLVLLNLTPKGETLLSNAMKAHTANMEKLLSHLSEKDIDTLSRILDILIVVMEEKNEK